MLSQMHLFSQEIQKFVLSAEGLMFHDVKPQTITPTDLEAIRYYVQCLSEKFCSSPSTPQKSKGTNPNQPLR